MTRNFRLPLVSFGVKSLEDYFEFRRNGEIRDGFSALIEYRSYLRKRRTAAGSRLRQALLDYNKQDLDATLCVMAGLSNLASDIDGRCAG